MGSFFSSVDRAVGPDVFSTVIGYYMSCTIILISFGVWNSHSTYFFSFLMTCVIFGWSVFFVCYALGNRLFLHNLLDRILGLCCCFLVLLQSLGFWCLLHYRPCHCFLRMMSTFTFLESSLFLSNKCWSCTLIIIPHWD